MSNHIIHKQHVIINIPGMDNAFSYQNTVSDLFSNGLSTAIEDILDEIDVPNTITRIDKLKLDLGKINALHFADEFKDKLIQELKHSLNTINNKNETQVTVARQSESLREGFVYFIEKGILPWYIEAKDMTGFETMIKNKWDKTDWLFVTGWFNKNAAFYKQAIERLVLQFSDEFLKQMLSVALGEIIDDEEWKKLLHDLKYVYSQLDEFYKEESKKYLIKTFDLLLHQNKSYTLDVLIAEQFLFLITQIKNDISLAKQYHIISDNVQTNLVAVIIKNLHFFHENKVPLQSITSNDLLSKDSSDQNRIDKFNLLKNAKTDLNEEESSAITNIIQPDEKLDLIIHKAFLNDNGNALFVDNCGVIVLHPFLLSYFEGLSLTKNKKFISDKSQKRAILLLYYLSTGFTEVAEFNLLLQKILCGYTSEESLPAQVELTQQEIDESAKLLQTVINYWPPLKNTSIKGLQNTFLQRKGKLTATETGWQLTVEQKTVDVLLGKLPWGFSTIRLPWMNVTLSIDWC